MSLDHDYIFKLILLGDSGVGKSSTLLQFMEKGFNEDHSSTIGIEYGSNTIKYTHMNKKKPGFKVLKIKLTCWDCAGQERYRSVVKSYYRNTSGIIMVFDLTRRETFESLEYWLKELEDARGSDLVPIYEDSKSTKKGLGEPIGYRRYPPVILVGNKKDLGGPESSERAITEGEVLEFVKKHHLDMYIETSAKTGENVASVFREIATLILSHVEERGPGLEGVTDPLRRSPEWYELETYRPQTSCCTIL